MTEATQLARNILDKPFDHSNSEKTTDASVSPEVLADIYREDSNIVVWQRELSTKLRQAVTEFIAENSTFNLSSVVKPSSTYQYLADSMGHALSRDIAELVEMYAMLFELKRVGLRVAVLHSAMCPKFHTDKVPVRLVTTYAGAATEWVPQKQVKQAKSTAARSNIDLQTLLQTECEQLIVGDVALLKGESWEGNENAGLVHRSPSVREGEKRLLLSLDFSD